MKKSIIFASLLALIGFVIFFSCRKTNTSPYNDPSFTNVNDRMKIRLARRIYDKLKAEEGNLVTATHIKVTGDAQPNRKYLIWQKAWEGQTDSTTFVEVPMMYNKRPST